MEHHLEDVTRSYERASRKAENQTYVLRLYVTGFTAASTRAISHLKALCETNLRGRFELEVIDILQRPALAKGEQIIATPTLVKLLPAPVQRFIGDLSGIGGRLYGLDLRPRKGRAVDR
jgi:circadian clock protein KaiB